jgi:type I restriction-modification system DNA methylase subunit
MGISLRAHKTLRPILIEEQRLDAVISLPGGVFKPYAGVSTAILLFTKTNSAGTEVEAIPLCMDGGATHAGCTI